MGYVNILSNPECDKYAQSASPLAVRRRRLMKVSFSLASNKTKATGAAPPLKQPVAFASLDDDPVDAAPTASGSRDTQVNKKLIAQNVGSSRTMKKRIAQEKEVDKTVYQYDEMWDMMQEARQRKKEEKDGEAKTRKVSASYTVISCS